MDSTALIVCMPTRGSLTLETHEAIACNMDRIPFGFMTVARQPVDQARNQLWKMARKVYHQNPFPGHETFVLWIDDDAWWAPGTITRMGSMLHSHPGLDVLSCCYSRRTPFQLPVGMRQVDGRLVPVLPLDADPDGLLDLASGGFHFTIHHASLLDGLDNPFAVPTDFVGGEDYAFCATARKAGCSIFVDMRALVAHVDSETGLAFLPGQPPSRIESNRCVPAPEFAGLGRDEILKRFSAEPNRDYGAVVNAGTERAAGALEIKKFALRYFQERIASGN